MTDSKANIYLLDENINDIFERKIEVGAVIQFNLLQRLIEEFIKRQKSINDKVNILEIKLNTLQSIPIEPLIEDDKTLNEFEFEESNTNFEIEKYYNKELKDKDNNNINNNQINNGKNDNIKNENNKDIKSGEKNKKRKKMKIESPNLININDQYHKLTNRMDKLEIFIKEITQKLINSNGEEKVDMEILNKNVPSIQKYDGIIINEENIIKEDFLDNEQRNKKKEKEIKKEIEEIKKEIEKLKKKEIKKEIEEKKDEKDFSENEKKEKIINDSSDFIDTLTKKLELLENKEKQYEEDINQIKKELNDINNVVYSDKNNYNDFVKEMHGNINENKNKHNNDIDNIKNLINENLQHIKDEFNYIIEQNNIKIKDMIIETTDNYNNNTSNNNNTNYMTAAKVNNEKLNNMNNELKSYINKSTADTEKYLKSIINNLGIDYIKNDLKNLHEEIKDKLSKSDLDFLDIKLKEFETTMNNHNLKIDMIKKDIDGCNNTCTKSVEMIEYLSGQVVQAYQPDLEQAKNEEMIKKINTLNDKDQSYLNKNDFDKEIKNIYKKIEQTLEIESENYKFIKHIESRLKYFVTQNELKTMEQCIINLIEELKNDLSKKYMEKSEIMKNLKILELQIKNIYENNPNLLHLKESDNWLLAKKPMNNYLCASCESYIGELKNKNMYIPWNKIPSHDSKKYRMGNGFSRMLQLVNTDLMKNAEKINNNLTIKIDDKKTNYELLKQLPRIGSQISMRHLNHPHSTFSLINNDNMDNRLNNSADGLDNLEEKNNISSNNNNNIQDIVGQEQNIKNTGLNSSKNNDKENSPKVVKIIKKFKKDSN